MPYNNPYLYEDEAKLMLRNHMNRAWYGQMGTEKSFINRVSTELKRTLLGREDIYSTYELTGDRWHTDSERHEGLFGSPTQWADDFENKWCSYGETSNFARGMGYGFCALTYTYAAVATVVDLIPTFLREATLYVNLYLNSLALSIAQNTDDDYKKLKLGTLTFLKAIAMTLHGVTSALSFMVHLVTHLPENISRFPFCGFVNMLAVSFSVSTLICAAFFVSIATASGLLAPILIVLAGLALFESVVSQPLDSKDERESDTKLIDNNNINAPFVSAWKMATNTRDDNDRELIELPNTRNLALT